MTKKYILFSVILIVTFITGVLYENYRVREQADRISALLITQAAYENAKYQLGLFGELTELIEQEKLDDLKKTVEKHKQNANLMIKDMKDFCQREKCTNKEKEFLDNVFKL
jgi:hypothetical protein